MRVLLVDERVHRRGHRPVQRVLVRGREKADDDGTALRVPNALLCLAEKRPVLGRKAHSTTFLKERLCQEGVRRIRRRFPGRDDQLFRSSQRGRRARRRCQPRLPIASWTDGNFYTIADGRGEWRRGVGVTVTEHLHPAGYRAEWRWASTGGTSRPWSMQCLGRIRRRRKRGPHRLPVCR
jgi:hypothetical protein